MKCSWLKEILEILFLDGVEGSEIIAQLAVNNSFIHLVFSVQGKKYTAFLLI